VKIKVLWFVRKMKRQCAKATDQFAQEVAGRPVFETVRAKTSWTCVYMRREAMVVEKVSGGQTHWSTGHVARLTGHHFASYCPSQVGGASPWPYKYPLLVNVDTHTPHFGDSTCKAPILSVVARRRLVRRVVML
jgi:hypothetical protein